VMAGSQGMAESAGRGEARGPVVSVIIPAFNRAHYIGDAVRSILAQTLDDLELIVVDDGSTDESVAVALASGDPRVRVVRHQGNRGIPQARNSGLTEARGEFIAWLDSDDIARPKRLQEQVEFLKHNPEVAMIGCCAGKISQDGLPASGIRVPPLSSSDIGAWLLFRSAFQQSSVTGRATVLKKYRYDLDYPVCEDLDMFLRLAETYPIANMPRVLIDRRLHPDQTIRLEKDSIRERKAKLFAPRLERLGMRFSPEDLGRHVLLGNPKGFRADAEFLDWAEAWLQQMREANGANRCVDSEGLRLSTAYFWALACNSARKKLGPARATRTFFRSALAAGLLSSHGRSWLGAALPLHADGGRRR